VQYMYRERWGGMPSPETNVWGYPRRVAGGGHHFFSFCPI
jgi:hypothetical protein